MVDESLAAELRERSKKEGMQAVLDDFERRGVSYHDMQEAIAGIKVKGNLKKAPVKTELSTITLIFLALLVSAVFGLFLARYRSSSHFGYWISYLFVIFGFIILESLILWVSASVITQDKKRFRTALKTKLFGMLWIVALLLVTSVFSGIARLIIFGIFLTLSEIAIICFFFEFPLSKAFVSYFIITMTRLLLFAFFTFFHIWTFFPPLFSIN
ncbi:MAG: hypothetical protein V1735_06680 [Nanoarchaeota archaeon]